MKKFIFSVIVILPLVVGNFLPVVVRADNNGAPSLFPLGYWGTNPDLLPCVGSASSTTRSNPTVCTNVCQAVALTRNVIYLGMSLVVFVLAPILLIWGGILIMVAGASPDLINKGKSVLTGTVIGILIAVLAFLIVQTFIQFLGVTQGLIQGFGDNIVCKVPEGDQQGPRCGGTTFGWCSPGGTCQSGGPNGYECVFG